MKVSTPNRGRGQGSLLHGMLQTPQNVGISESFHPLICVFGKCLWKICSATGVKMMERLCSGQDKTMKIVTRSVVARGSWRGQRDG